MVWGLKMGKLLTNKGGTMVRRDAVRVQRSSDVRTTNGSVSATVECVSTMIALSGAMIYSAAAMRYDERDVDNDVLERSSV